MISVIAKDKCRSLATIQLLYGPAPTRLGSDHPAPVLPRAYTTRIRPLGSCTAPRLHDSDRTTQLQYYTAPTRLGSDWLGPALSRRASTTHTGRSGTQPQCQLSESPIEDLGVQDLSEYVLPAPRRSWQAPPTGINKSLISRESTSPSPPGPRQAPQLPLHTRDKYPQLRPAPCWII